MRAVGPGGGRRRRRRYCGRSRRRRSRRAVFFIGTKSSDLVFDGLAFDSQWPLNGEYGSKKVPARGFTMGRRNVTIRNCSFRNVTDGVNTELKPVGLLVADCASPTKSAGTATGATAPTT